MSYSSRDGRARVGGATWRRRLGQAARPGLVAMGGAGHEAVSGRASVASLYR